MASEKNLNAIFTDTANAIRGKTGTSAKIKPYEFADKIASIEIGVDAPAGTYSITTNGTYDVAKYAEVSVRVPDNSITGVAYSAAYSKLSVIDTFAGTIIDTTQKADLTYEIGPRSTIKLNGASAVTTHSSLTLNLGANSATTITLASGGTITDASGQLIASNIAKGKTIFGVTGTYSDGYTEADIAALIEADY